MGFITNESPNASYYDSDLRELITTYTELKTNYDGIFDEMAELTEKVNEVYVYVDEKIAEGLEATIATVNARMEEIETELARLETLINEYQEDTDERFTTERELTTAEITAQVNALAIITMESIQMLQAEIDAIEVEMLPIYNPTTAADSSIATAVFDVWEKLRDGALSCAEYDALGVTCERYESYGMTCDEYATENEYFIVDTKVFSAYNGSKVTIQNMLNAIAVMAGNGITTATYALAQLSCDDYQALDITAYEFDFDASNYITV